LKAADPGVGLSNLCLVNKIVNIETTARSNYTHRFAAFIFGEGLSFPASELRASSGDGDLCRFAGLGLSVEMVKSYNLNQINTHSFLLIGLFSIIS
jgi:hypothetical protein